MRGVLYVLMALLLLPHSVRAEALKAHAFELENGLKVRVVEYHRAPVVTHMLWFKTGAADDPPGYSGVAHYLEHMMFKGTPTVPDGEYTRRIEEMGGEHNAFTGMDFTAYYVTIAKERVPDVMKLEADRMQHLKPSGFDSEREVIIEERRSRIDNQPGALLAEKMAAKMFGDYPYGRPIIGWKEEMATLSPASVMEYYNTHYHPTGAVLVLVGDITPAEAKKLAEKYYGDWRPAGLPGRAWPAPQFPKEPQRVSFAHPEVRQTEWARDYPAASLKWGAQAQTFPLLLLSDLLGGGRTGWLYQRLVVERKLAVEAEASYSPFSLGPAVFGVSLVPAPNVTVEALEKAYEEEVAAFMQREIPPQDLERVKNSLKASAIYLRDGLQSQAYMLGQLVMLGFEVEFFNDWTAKIDAVTAEEILKAAKDTVQENIAVTGILLPEKTGKNAR